MASQPPANDPANLDEAVPASDRDQGAQQSLPDQAIVEAAQDGVGLGDTADEGLATSAGSGTRETD